MNFLDSNLTFLIYLKIVWHVSVLFNDLFNDQDAPKYSKNFRENINQKF